MGISGQNSGVFGPALCCFLFPLIIVALFVFCRRKAVDEAEESK